MDEGELLLIAAVRLTRAMPVTAEITLEVEAPPVQGEIVIVTVEAGKWVRWSTLHRM